MKMTRLNSINQVENSSSLSDEQSIMMEILSDDPGSECFLGKLLYPFFLIMC